MLQKFNNSMYAQSTVRSDQEENDPQNRIWILLIRTFLVFVSKNRKNKVMK